MNKSKYPIGLEFTIQKLISNKTWTFANCDKCSKDRKCEICGKLGGGHQDYLHMGDRVRIKKICKFRQKDKYVLELLDRDNEVSDFLSEEDLDFMIGSQRLDITQYNTNNKITNIPHYPEDFYDFSNGVDINDNQINVWIKQCIDYINEENTNFSFIASGNAKVIVFKFDDGEYEVNVIKDYKGYNYIK